MEANELRSLRRGALNLSQDKLAEVLGVTSRTISTYETAKQPIPPYMALAIKCLVYEARVMS